jgi:hypothetical protein
MQRDNGLWKHTSTHIYILSRTLFAILGWNHRWCIGCLRNSNTQPTDFVIKKQEQVFSLKSRGKKQHHSRCLFPMVKEKSYCYRYYNYQDCLRSVTV